MGLWFRVEGDKTEKKEINDGPMYFFLNAGR